jgi:hypothetical protein
LFGLLPTAGAAGPSAMGMMMSHDYMITPLHRQWDGFLRKRTELPGVLLAVHEQNGAAADNCTDE